MLNRKKTAAGDDGSRNDDPAAESSRGRTDAARIADELSVIAADVRLTGEMRTNKDVRVYGSFDGVLECGELFIAAGASVSGEVRAQVIKVVGHLTGKVEAKVLIAAKTAVVEGEVSVVQIGTELGARIVARMDAPGVPAAEARSVQSARPAEKDAAGDEEVLEVSEVVPDDTLEKREMSMPFLIRSAA